MKFTVQVVVEAGSATPAVREVFAFERAALGPGNVGLAMAEAKGPPRVGTGGRHRRAGQGSPPGPGPLPWLWCPSAPQGHQGDTLADDFHRWYPTSPDSLSLRSYLGSLPSLASPGLSRSPER